MVVTPSLLDDDRLMHLAFKCTPFKVQYLHPEHHVLHPLSQMSVKIVLEHVAPRGEKSCIVQVIFSSGKTASATLSYIFVYFDPSRV